MLRTLLEKSEDCHQKSDQTKRCRRTTSEQASSRDAHDNERDCCRLFATKDCYFISHECVVCVCAYNDFGQ